MKTVIINSPQSRLYALSLVGEILVDGKTEVVIKKVGMSSTDKQRRLRWLWNTDVAHSGLGRHDTKDGVDLAAKWQFARPILLRDDGMFGTIYNYFMEVVQGSDNFAEYCREFTARYISVERMTKAQAVEYLSEFQRFWLGKGVELTNPESQGLDLEALAKRYTH